MSLFLHYRWIAQQPTAFTRWIIHRWRETERSTFYFHSPRNVHDGVSREHAPVVILAADSKRSFLGGMDRHEGLPISVRLAMCSAERERDPSGCRASGLTPELPVHVVPVTSLLVPPPSPAVVVTKKSSGFYSCWSPHWLVDAILLSFFCST